MVDRRLGRGLDFFLSGGRQAQPSAPTRPVGEPEEDRNGSVQSVPLDRLDVNPFQPRREVAEQELRELADSIRVSGILQPILVRPVGERLQIVAGERRWRAARLAELNEVPVLVRSLSDQESALFALVENLQREDLNAIEKAKGLSLLLDQTKGTQEQVAKQVGLDRSSVANFLRLLDLPEAVQAHVSRGTLSMGHARCLLPLPDAETIVRAADMAIRQGLSVRQLESTVKQMLGATEGDPTPAAGVAQKRTRPVWLNELEENLVESLSTPVTIRYGRKKSQIVIECTGREQFERIYQRIKNC